MMTLLVSQIFIVWLELKLQLSSVAEYLAN